MTGGHLGTGSAFPAPMSSPGTKSAISESPPLTPSADLSRTSSVLPSPALMSTPLPSPMLHPSSSGFSATLPTTAHSAGFLPVSLTQQSPEPRTAIGKHLKREASTLLEMAGVREESLLLPDLPTCEASRFLSDAGRSTSHQSLPTGAGLADQLNVLLDDPFGKPSHASQKAIQQQNNQLYHSIAM